METIALTGATSMIGLALIKQCLQNNVRVIAFTRFESPRLDRLSDSELIIKINCALEHIADFDGFDRIVNHPEIFYHLGWSYTDKQGRNDSDEQLKNVKYTLDAVRLAKRLGCKRFIGAGSQAEYGSASVPLNDKVAVDPDIAYGVAKYAAGKLAKIECKNLGMEYIWGRILSVYGTNDNNYTLIKTFIKNCMNNNPMLLGPCTHIWDYLYEDDAGRAFFDIGEKGKNGKIYCLGSGTGRPLKEYLEIMKGMLNPNYDIQYGKIPYNEKSVKYLCADISELSADTGWKPRIFFEEGVGKIIDQLPPPRSL